MSFLVFCAFMGPYGLNQIPVNDCLIDGSRVID